jgi:hypothetical protein
MTALQVLEPKSSRHYQRKLKSDDAVDGAALGKRALALIYTGQATYDTFRITQEMTISQMAIIIAELEARAPRFWLGKRSRGDLIYYKSPIPLKNWRGYTFVSAIGPFLSRLSAAYYIHCEFYGQGALTPAQIECQARQDNNPIWASLRESIESEQSLSASDLDAERKAQAVEFEPDNSMPIASINIASFGRKSVSLIDLSESLV